MKRRSFLGSLPLLAGLALFFDSVSARAAAIVIHGPLPSSGASWLAALNTNVSVVVTGGNAQLRLRVEAINNGGGGDTAFKWMASKNGAAYADVAAASSNVKTFNSANFADGDDVPQRLGVSSYLADNNAAEESTGTFTLGAALTATIESEIAIELVAADLANNDTLDFRLTKSDGTVFTTYTQTPRINVVK